MSQEREHRFVLRLAPEPEAVATARLFAGALARTLRCGEEDIDDVRIAISEATTRAIRAHDTGSVEISAVVSDTGLAFEIPGAGSAATGSDSDVTLAVIRSLFPETEDIGPDRTTLRFGTIKVGIAPPA